MLVLIQHAQTCPRWHKLVEKDMLMMVMMINMLVSITGHYDYRMSICSLSANVIYIIYMSNCVIFYQLCCVCPVHNR